MTLSNPFATVSDAKWVPDKSHSVRNIEKKKHDSAKSEWSIYLTSILITISSTDAAGFPSFIDGKNFQFLSVLSSKRFNLGLGVGLISSTVVVPSTAT